MSANILLQTIPVKPVAFDNPMQPIQALGQYWVVSNENPGLVQTGNA